MWKLRSPDVVRVLGTTSSRWEAALSDPVGACVGSSAGMYSLGLSRLELGRLVARSYMQCAVSRRATEVVEE